VEDGVVTATVKTDKLELFNNDCLKILPELPDNSVDLILTDPPYFKVKGEAWDNQWKDVDRFLAWLDSVIAEFYRVLKPSGSMYVFCSPKLANSVERLIAERFQVLNNIRWIKNTGYHKKASRKEMRRFREPWEGVIFSEHKNSDLHAKGVPGYETKCDRLRGELFGTLREYIVKEFEASGVNRKEFNQICGFAAISGGMASRHYLSSSQWCLPTEEHYTKLQTATGRFQRPWSHLKAEYDLLYECYLDFRRPFEMERRAFEMKEEVEHTDLWYFDIIPPYKGRHSCEKPLDLLEHAILSSSRPGDVVLDAFMGSGSTGVACQNTERKFIGIEMSGHWFTRSLERMGLI
jgi:site-specific DNA-methyltransferase (adenine-specific)